MKVLITGGGGFVGEHLIKKLLSGGHAVSVVGLANGAFLQKYDLSVHEVDILNASALQNVVKLEKPDTVIHLAAQSNVPAAWENPALTASVNINGTINMLLAVVKEAPFAKILNVGSSDEYGLTAKCGLPLTEEMECKPQNPYSISKLCAEQMALKLAQKYSVNVIHLRPFNHFGPGQRKGFVVSDFASQIAEIEAGKKAAEIRVGDLSASRDFLFVEDVVNAYIKAAELSIPGGIYNICSGYARKIEDILKKLLSLSKHKITIAQDKEKIRPSEVPVFIGSFSKLSLAASWSPLSSFDDALLKTLNYWRNLQ